MNLYIKIFTIFTFFALNNMNAQDARDVITKYRFKLYEEKKLKPISSVKLSLEIETKEGKFPATLWIVENMVYKLELAEGKGKSIEYIDPSSYKLMSANGKEKQIGEFNSELHFRKKLWLNFYPLLNYREDMPMKVLDQGMDLNGASTLSVAAATSADVTPIVEEHDPSVTKIVQLLPFNEMAHIFYVDMKTFHVVKLETKYFQEGIEKKDKVLYEKYARSPEGYSYPTSFTTVFGLATVKSIQFNPRLNPTELEVKF